MDCSLQVRLKLIMDKQYHFVAISGSLRKGSYNTMTLKAMQQVSPPNITIEQLSIEGIPLFNQDLHHDDVFPEQVFKLNEAIKAADAVILVSPEYNYSISGPMKNAIDMLSRLKGQGFDMKAVGIAGASPGLFGTARAQNHLRQVLTFVNAYVMNKPGIMIGQANTKFDEAGNLTDEKTKEFLKKFLESLAEFSERFRK
jgi:chromate reductase, NAD(P)H dehydrogenase (quinone)